MTNHVIDKNVPIPLYYQLKTFILEDITNGTYPSDSMIPTEKELCDIFDISRTTVRQAIAELVQEGYLYRIKSRGTFVTKPKVKQHILIENSYEAAIKESGGVPQTEILSMEIVAMPASMVSLGAGTPNDKAIRIYRVRMDNDVPLMRVVSYLPYSKFEHLTIEDLQTSSLHDIMDRSSSTKVARMSRTCEAVLATKEDVKVLGIHLNSPVQFFTTIRYNSDNEVLDYSYAYYRGDKNKIHFEINYAI